MIGSVLLLTSLTSAVVFVSALDAGESAGDQRDVTAGCAHSAEAIERRHGHRVSGQQAPLEVRASCVPP